MATINYNTFPTPTGQFVKSPTEAYDYVQLQYNPLSVDYKYPTIQFTNLPVGMTIANPPATTLPIDQCIVNIHGIGDSTMRPFVNETGETSTYFNVSFLMKKINNDKWEAIKYSFLGGGFHNGTSQATPSVKNNPTPLKTGYISGKAEVGNVYRWRANFKFSNTCELGEDVNVNYDIICPTGYSGKNLWEIPSSHFLYNPSGYNSNYFANSFEHIEVTEQFPNEILSTYTKVNDTTISINESLNNQPYPLNKLYVLFNKPS